MSNNNKILVSASIIIALALGFYIGTVRNNKKDNIADLYVKESQKQEKKEVRQSEIEGALLRVKGREFRFTDLPSQMQKSIIGESLNYRQNINELLKGFAVQYLVAKSKNPNVEIDPTTFPDIVTFYDGIVKDEDVEEVYKKNIGVFPMNHDVKQIKAQIKVQLILNKITEFTESEIEKLVEANGLTLLLKNVSLPINWFDYEQKPKLTNAEKPEIRINLLMSYSCASCSVLGAQIGELVQIYDPKKIQIGILHISKKHLDVGYYLNKAAMCVHKNDRSDFWKLNLKLLSKSKEISLLKEDDLDNARKILEVAFGEAELRSLTMDQLLTCIRDDSDKNDITKYLTSVMSDFRFTQRLPLPIIFVNESRVDMTGGTLIETVRIFLEQNQI